MTFSQLNLSEPLLQALKRKNYTQPTPIQEKSIPAILEGKDIFGRAQTGTGKTAAFALPILQMMDAKRTVNFKKGVKALILAPTRELATQINESFAAYGQQLRFRHITIFGGVSQRPQADAIRKGVDIVIATPGRLLDLMQQGIVRLDAVEYLVLDEADRMLDMGFIHDIKRIIAKVPQNRQTLFFSATAPQDIMHLANAILKNPIHVKIDAETTASELVDQSVYHVRREDKRSLLRHVLNGGEISNALVFTRTKRGADKVAKELIKNGIKAESIHGNKSQSARDKALKGFKSKHIRVLVATDIASRGIDVVNLSHVINFEIPEQAETYVHRIGRTGRAGMEGKAISFCCSEERDLLNDIQKLLRRKLPVESHPFS